MNTLLPFVVKLALGWKHERMGLDIIATINPEECTIAQTCDTLLPFGISFRIATILNTTSFSWTQPTLFLYNILLSQQMWTFYGNMVHSWKRILILLYMIPWMWKMKEESTIIGTNSARYCVTFVSKILRFMCLLVVLIAVQRYGMQYPIHHSNMTLQGRMDQTARRPYIQILAGRIICIHEKIFSDS